jgi:hypothetical protein
MANLLFSFNFIFLCEGLMVARRNERMFCRYIPLLAGPIPWLLMDLGQPDLSEA